MWGIVALLGVVLAYVIFHGKITVSPLAERDRMMLLEEVKGREARAPFVSDGCSGNISTAWLSLIHI